MFKEKKVLIISLSVLLVILVVSFFVFNYERQDSSLEITNFQECVDAGNVVMEMYPAQCLTPDGKIFVQDIDNGDDWFLDDDEDSDFYGSSTNFPCEVNEDCIISGCNSEICQSSQEEEMASVCLLPDEPLPQDLGYSCGCFELECQWSR